MSASGIFASAQSTLVASLTGLGLAVVTDSRNARPMTVFVEPPTFTALTATSPKSLSDSGSSQLPLATATPRTT